MLQAVGVKGAHGFEVLDADHDAHHSVMLEHAHRLTLRTIQKLAKSVFASLAVNVCMSMLLAV